MPNKNMKVLIAGDWEYDIYERALFEGFQRLGVSVLKFSFAEYIKHPGSQMLKTMFFHRDEIEYVNEKLVEYVSSTEPDLVFLQRPVFINKRTIYDIKKKSGAKLISYHNDNPFANIKNKLKNISYIRSLDSYDLNFVYRPSNLKDVKKRTDKPVEILKPFYVKGLHKKLNVGSKTTDVIFIGHYEKSRNKYCKAVILNDINLKVYGPGWRNENGIFEKGKNLFGSVDYKKYSRLLNESKIALAFLSRMNNDVYTRRNFEIPATGTFMLSERTPELQEIFIEGEECDYFSSVEELVDKLEFYLKNPTTREKIALAGYNKCVRTHNSNLDRVKEIIKVYQKLLEK